MKSVYLFLCTLIFSGVSFSQKVSETGDSINKTDSKGFMQGYWEVTNNNNTTEKVF